MTSTLQDLNDSDALVDATAEAIGRLVTQAVANEVSQVAEIQRLKDLLASGSAVTHADLDALVTRSQARKARLETVLASLQPIAAVPGNPAPGPVPPSDEGPVDPGVG